MLLSAGLLRAPAAAEPSPQRGPAPPSRCMDAPSLPSCDPQYGWMPAPLAAAGWSKSGSEHLVPGRGRSPKATHRTNVHRRLQARIRILHAHRIRAHPSRRGDPAAGPSVPVRHALLLLDVGTLALGRPTAPKPAVARASSTSRPTPPRSWKRISLMLAGPANHRAEAEVVAGVRCRTAASSPAPESESDHAWRHRCRTAGACTSLPRSTDAGLLSRRTCNSARGMPPLSARHRGSLGLLLSPPRLGLRRHCSGSDRPLRRRRARSQSREGGHAGGVACTGVHQQRHGCSGSRSSDEREPCSDSAMSISGVLLTVLHRARQGGLAHQQAHRRRRPSDERPAWRAFGGATPGQGCGRVGGRRRGRAV